MTTKTVFQHKKDRYKKLKSIIFNFVNIIKTEHNITRLDILLYFNNLMRDDEDSIITGSSSIFIQSSF
ncbi:hypothetical protein KL86DYS1_10849 [uncultured Dysgonomonas sp.]|uniref:Uncharacterized protein n=1 Tax=uncultured Dysgonomonas sp. TaxID=206096 RepID=A0A212J1S6_9BACT|nr:hypothetical protein KL86DYS1_10849 [uncultured Dysgonomonas sp.]